MASENWRGRYRRQYERVKRHELARGKPEELAEETARRVVELRRQLEARSQSESPGPHSAQL